MWVTCRDEAVDPHIATLPNPECTVLGLKIMRRVPAGVHDHHPVTSSHIACRHHSRTEHLHQNWIGSLVSGSCNEMA